MVENKEQVELNDEQLEKVAGGVTVACGRQFTGHVGQWDAIEGEKYFVTDDNHDDTWFAGKCNKTYEKTILFWSRRVHEIHVIYKGSASKGAGGTWEFAGSDYTLFKYMNGRTVQQCEDLNKWD